MMRNKHNRVPDFNSFMTHAGNKFHSTFDSFFRKDGTIELRESGKKDIQKEINSHLAETDMAVIIHKLQFGDTSVLSSKPPMFGDFTQFPSTYAEVLDIVNRSEKAFQSLSPEIKSKYDNDRNKWFSAIGSEDWLKDMGLYVPPAPTPAPSPAPSPSPAPAPSLSPTPSPFTGGSSHE